MGRQPTVRQASCRSQHDDGSQLKQASCQNLDQRRKSSRSKRRSSLQVEPKQRIGLILWLLQRYTSFIWLAALSILIGSATAAITTILDPDASISHFPSHGASPHSISTVSPPAPSTQVPLPGVSAATEKPERSSGSSSHSPQFSRRKQPQPAASVSPQSAVGAIALSCAAGCFLLSQGLRSKPTAKRRIVSETRRSALKQTQPSPQQAQQIEATNSAETPYAEIVTPASVQPHPPNGTSISFDLGVSSPQAAEDISPEAILSTAMPTDTPPIQVEVTVLPANQSHPLDWNEPSLADSLDLRQRRPLSYWL